MERVRTNNFVCHFGIQKFYCTGLQMGLPSFEEELLEIFVGCPLPSAFIM
jgi:hypothetical protein